MKHDRKRQSGRSIQTSLFFGSLVREMNKLAEKKSRLVRSAEEYSSQGCSQNEIEELLTIDGFEGDMVRSYLLTSSSSDRTGAEHGRVWGFEIEDACGEIVTHSDLNMEIRASTKEEAVLKVEGLMKSEKDAGLSKIIGVYEI